MTDNLMIRTAVPEDAAGLLRIYAPYVERTAVTFEYEVPTEAEFRARIGKTLERYPYLVAESADGILGYAYAGPFHPRAAYDWCAELSVYVDWNARGQGIGRTLYAALEDDLRAMGMLNLYACIAIPEQEDEYLDSSSVAFHSRMGFETVGQFRRCGYKFRRWYHMIWMEKIIGEHLRDQPPVTVFRRPDNP